MSRCRHDNIRGIYGDEALARGTRSECLDCGCDNFDGGPTRPAAFPQEADRLVANLVKDILCRCLETFRYLDPLMCLLPDELGTTKEARKRCKGMRTELEDWLR